MMRVHTSEFGRHYTAQHALVFFQRKNKDAYVELYDMDSQNRPINARPLCQTDAETLAKTFLPQVTPAFFQCNGLLPQTVLFLRPEADGVAIWYTPPMKKNLMFIDGLAIPNGKAVLPGLVWKASKTGLSVFALAKTKGRPTLKTPLFYAPFFNIYENGQVCMGNVTLDFSACQSLETFTAQWEAYFFNSYFSHMIGNKNRCKTDMAGLWRSLVNQSTAFPTEQLQPMPITLSSLLS